MDLENERFEEFECALSKDGHIVKEPITLRCGHYICKQHCKKESNIIFCNKCGETIRNDKESFIAKEMIKRNIEKLISIVKQKLIKSYHDFKSKINLK